MLDGRAGCGRAAVVLLTLSRCCRAESWPAAERATAAELQALALRVERRPARARTLAAQRAELAAVARQRDACGALRIARTPGPGGGHVTIALTDRATGKTAWRELPLPRTANAASIVALRVVELLRASLLELRMADRPRSRVPLDIAGIANDVRLTGAAGAADRGRRVRRRPAAVSPSWGFRVEGSVLGGPGGVSAVGQLGLALRVAVWSHLSLELAVASTVVSSRLRSEGVASAMDLGACLGWVFWELPRRGRWRPAVGLGGGVLVPWVAGGPSERFRPRRDASLSGVVAAAAQLAVVIAPRLWLRLAFLLGVSLPEIEVRYGSATAATFGRPYLGGTVGLEVRLP